MAELSTVSTNELTQFASSLLEAAGVEASEAKIVAESLVEANLCGHESHGVVQIPGYVRQLRSGELVAGARLKTLSETASLHAADACFGFGPVQCLRLIELLKPNAHEQGIACGTMHNCGHVGRLGAWVQRLAADGLAALMTVNDNGVLRCVAPPGGTEPCLSTNPLAISIPTADEPLTLDISTSTVAQGKVLLDYLAGTESPAGWLQDAAGKPTTKPAVRFRDPRGSILPLGGEQGYKGFGLALMLDLLVGGLSGGLCPPAGEADKMTNNVLLVVWDPARFAGQSHFAGEAAKLIAYLRNSPRKPGVKSIRLPGDRSSELARRRENEGIPLAAAARSSLAKQAEALSVPVPTWLR